MRFQIGNVSAAIILISENTVSSRRGTEPVLALTTAGEALMCSTGRSPEVLHIGLSVILSPYVNVTFSVRQCEDDRQYHNPYLLYCVARAVGVLPLRMFHSAAQPMAGRTGPSVFLFVC